MNSLKSLPIILALFFTAELKAQNTEATCIQSRYISLYPCKENTPLFTFKETNDEKSLMAQVQKHGYTHVEVRDVHKLGSWVELFAVNYQSTTPLPNRHGEDSVETINGVIYYVYPGAKTNYHFASESTTPFANMYGEDSVIRINGVDSYVYPEIIALDFKASDINGIRIKEDRVLNKSTNKYEFKPVAIGFCVMNSSQLEVELFWVKLDELYENSEKMESFDWYQTISKQQYKGFQYMQLACD